MNSGENITGAQRFVNAIQFVIRHKGLIENMVQSPQVKTADVKVADEEETTTDGAQFLDPALFRRPRKAKPGVLTDSVKNIFKKNSRKRTQVDIEEAKEIMKDTPYFEKFPEEVLKRLSYVLVLLTYNKGQTVMRQGKRGWAMYIIYNGLIGVKLLVKDKSGRPIEIVVAQLGAGSQIGEVSLLKNHPRSASIVCIVTTIFFALYKEDFDYIMKDYIDREYSARVSSLTNLPSFRDVHWASDAFDLVINNSMVKYYTKDMLILGGVKDTSIWTYFIISGRCRITRLVVFLEENSKGNIILHEYKGQEIKPGQILRKKILQICTLHIGHYFSVGETLESTYILAANNVTIFLAPSILLNRYCRRNFTEKLYDELMHELPTLDRILEMYSKRLVWERYQDKVAADTMTGSFIHPINEKCCAKPRKDWNKYF